MRRRLQGFLAAAGACSLALTLEELTIGVQPSFLGGALPARHLQALGAVGFALVAGAIGCRPGWGKSQLRRAALVGCVSAAAMLANTRLLGSGDTRPAAYLPFALLRTHSLAFDRLLATNRCLPNPDGSLPYWFVRSGDHVVSKYPLAMGLLALPLELPSALGTFDLCSKEMNDLEKIGAAMLSALGVAFIFLGIEAMTTLWVGGLASLLYLGATPVLPVLGQALWQHVGAALALSLGLFGLFGLTPGSRRTATVSFAAGLAFACRPPDLPLALALLAAVLVERPRSFGLLVGMLPPAALALCNWLTLGTPWATGYGAEGWTGWTAFWPEGLAGLLVSPARGLVLLYPVLAVAFVGLLKRRASSAQTLQLRLLAAGLVAHLVLMAKWWCWTGGYAPAPRMLSDGLPFLAVGLGIAFADGWAWSSTWRALGFAGAAAISALCALLVTYVPPPAKAHDWIWDMTEGPWSWRAYPPLAYMAARAE